jgi:putative membrane protein
MPSRIPFPMTFVLAAALALSACGERSADDRAAAAPDSAAEEGPREPRATVGEAEAVSILMAANTTDSTSGVLGRDRARDPRVRIFAMRMVSEHGAANRGAAALAARLGITPRESPIGRQLRQGGEQTRLNLEEVDAGGFDLAYLDSEVEYHETVLDAIDRTLLPGVQNPELRALLQDQVRPAVESHLDHARRLQAQLSGQPIPATDSAAADSAAGS